jgi:hypothetical protein
MRQSVMASHDSIYILYSVGLRMAPCGTPAEIFFFSLRLDPILTWKVRSWRNDLTV